MKKTKVLLLLALIMGFVANTNAQKDNRALSGMSMNLSLGFPSASFGEVEDVPDDLKYKLMFGLKLGHQWYLAKTNKAGIGLMVNWLDITGVEVEGEGYNIYSGTFDTRATLDFSLLTFGPVGTYLINQNMAVDGYYNFRPTIFSTSYSNKNSDLITKFDGAGFSHAIGGAFRWKILNIGVEYVLGSIMCSYSSDERPLKTNSFRIYAGVKYYVFKF